MSAVPIPERKMVEQRSLDGIGYAKLSDCQRFRYRLQRRLTLGWEARESYKKVVFVMLNPSTADAFVLDPTVRRCIGFARAWEADLLEVVNLFALRSTDPRALYDLPPRQRGDDAENDGQIMDACAGAALVVAAWGVHGELGRRGREVHNMLSSGLNIDLHHLGMTRKGHPKHPLYLPAASALVPW